MRGLIDPYSSDPVVCELHERLMDLGAVAHVNVRSKDREWEARYVLPGGQVVRVSCSRAAITLAVARDEVSRLRDISVWQEAMQERRAHPGDHASSWVKFDGSDVDFVTQTWLRTMMAGDVRPTEAKLASIDRTLAHQHLRWLGEQNL